VPRECYCVLGGNGALPLQRDGRCADPVLCWWPSELTSALTGQGDTTAWPGPFLLPKLAV